MKRTTPAAGQRKPLLDLFPWSKKKASSASDPHQVITRKTAKILASWEVLWPDAAKAGLEECVRWLEQTARDPPLIMWPDPG